MALMLIDTREPWPPPPPEPRRRRRWDLPDWKAPLLLLAGFVLVLVSGLFAPGASYGLIIAGCVLIGLGFGGLGRGGSGLREHRQ